MDATIEEIQPEPQPESPPAPSYGEIFRFYLPLALSWLLMAVELPITAAVVSRSADAIVQAAALQMVMGLALWIESPVIDLLATSTTLSRSRQSYAVISRFVWQLMAVTAVVHALIALTPLYDAITKGLLGIPDPVAEAARIPMAILIPWSPFIGWRRYLQGILIRFGRTKLVGWGTGVRVCTMAIVSVALFSLRSLSGMTIAAIALVCSVAAEAFFIHWASRATIRERLILSGDDPHEPILEPRRLLKFHLPLTATTMTFMASLPLTSAAVARSPDSVVALAAWQVATSVAFLHRCVVFALPEPIIALQNGPVTSQRLARFCLMVGAAAALSIPIFVTFGLDRMFFEHVLKAPPETWAMASAGYLATMMVPFVGALQGYLRGMLTAGHRTAARLSAVLSSTAVLVVILQIGVGLRWPGVWVAAAGLTGSAIAEFGALAWSWRRARSQLA